MDTFSAPEMEDGITVPLDPEGVWFQWRTLFAYIGPGILMSIAFVDPGNLEADLQAGAYTGYQLVWVLFLSTALGLFMQCLAAKIGVVTGRHLAELCREEYPWYIYYPLWLMVEIAIVGSDIQEVMGTALALNLLFNLPLWIGCIITVLDAFLFLGLKGFGVRSLEAFFMSLVAVMSISFFINFSIDAPPAVDVFEGFIPFMEPYAYSTAIGLLGSVVMPHNIFLHSALVLTRSLDRESPARVRQSLKYTYLDSTFALFVSFLINLAVIGCFAYNFFDHDCATGETMAACVCDHTNEAAAYAKYGHCDNILGKGHCQEVGLSQAGEVLGMALGPTAKLVWAIGLLASGQSSTMTGAYAGQFVFEGFLRTNIPKWLRVLVTRCIALIPALFVAVASSSDPVLSDTLQQWLNILQSVQLPFALLPLLFILANRKVMGEYAIGNGMWCTVTTIIIILLSCNVYIIITSIPDSSVVQGAVATVTYTSIGISGAVYVFLIIMLISTVVMSVVKEHNAQKYTTLN
eukprot:CAMPEP_0117737904 /NCGR_PEP_ID=MMETSP0947-20121206/2804_1 /TAXON_ID=44440 /ORGANISM="Chattonella subsalsa, Strain CCMP2191" /LENGTH=518 /DNA_ID=CAMNT_0005553477 /DNA_START=164 /DNA_END=1720 /DNA_ORIENTATION=+